MRASKRLYEEESSQETKQQLLFWGVGGALGVVNTLARASFISRCNSLLTEIRQQTQACPKQNAKKTRSTFRPEFFIFCKTWLWSRHQAGVHVMTGVNSFMARRPPFMSTPEGKLYKLSHPNANKKHSENLRERA